MLSSLFVETNVPFLVAIGLMLAIALIEAVAMLLGGGLSSLIDSLLPDSLSGVDVNIDLDVDADVDVDMDVGAGPVEASALP